MQTTATAVAPAPTAGVDPVINAIRVYETLLQGREGERNLSDRKLNDPQYPLDRVELRSRLVECVRTKCGSGGELTRPGPSNSSTRAWILYTLGRVNDGDSTAISLVQQHLTANSEPDPWVRYWTLSGIARSRSTVAVDFAKRVLQDEVEYVKLVGVALLAADGDQSSLAQIRQDLESEVEYKQWCTLRALRVVALDDHQVVDSVIAIVNRGMNSDVTYDAIRALHHIGAQSRFARDGARALVGFVEKWRAFAGRDSMRAQALIGLGKLRAEMATPVLVEELTDGNPLIVREAAYSLEGILGTRTAVARVIEAASRPETASPSEYARALSWMEDREAVAGELASAMSSREVKQQDVARALLSEVGGLAALEKLRAQSNLMLQHSEFIKESERKMQDLFTQSIVDARSGFVTSIRMDVTVFAVGVLLLIASAVLQLVRKGDLATWVGSGATGVTGVLGVLYSLLVGKPRERVEEAVDHLMHLKIVFLGYLRQLHQIDQGYIRRLIEDEPMEAKDLQQYAAIIEENMKAADAQLRSPSRTEASANGGGRN